MQTKEAKRLGVSRYTEVKVWYTFGELEISNKKYQKRQKHFHIGHFFKQVFLPRSYVLNLFPLTYTC